MNVLRQEGDRFEFRLGLREKSVLCNVLDAYPVTPLAHHRLTRGKAGLPDDSDQTLLTESMAALNAENRRRLDTFLAARDRFVREDKGYRVTFQREELEWLLRVLNDVRVGSWLRLGAPDPDTDPDPPPKPTAESVRHLTLMEVAGQFQFALLAALDGTDGVGWGGRAA